MIDTKKQALIVAMEIVDVCNKADGCRNCVIVIDENYYCGDAVRK